MYTSLLRALLACNRIDEECDKCAADASRIRSVELRIPIVLDRGRPSLESADDGYAMLGSV